MPASSCYYRCAMFAPQGISLLTMPANAVMLLSHCVVSADVKMHSIRLQDNLAGLQGGAVSVAIAARIHGLNCTFEGNRAFYAATNTTGCGGALSVDNSANVTLSNTTLFNNAAGSGGAICAAVNSWASITNGVRLVANQAQTSGGAVYLQDSALVSLSHGVLVAGNSAGADGGGISALANSTLELGPGVQITKNNAVFNGGGVCTSGTSRLVINSPPGNSTAVRVSGNLAGNGGGFGLLSEDFPWESVKATASHNTAQFGADYYIPVQHLQVADGATQRDVISRLDGPGQAFTIHATGPSGTPSAITVLASFQGEPVGSLKANDTTGLVTFKVPVRKPPGQYNLTFTPGVGGTNVTVLINVPSCPKGDVTASTGDACISCVAGSYSMNPQNNTCDKCPDNALCPGNWSVLPLEGFWSSSPSSVQIHRWESLGFQIYV